MSARLTKCPHHSEGAGDDNGGRPSRSQPNHVTMHTPYSLRIHRRRWALSQEELAELLSLSRTAITRLENESESTRLVTAFGLMVVFGIKTEVMQKSLYTQVEDAVMRRAAVLDEKLRGNTDPKSLRKIELLSDMIRRATGNEREV